MCSIVNLEQETNCAKNVIANFIIYFAAAMKAEDRTSALNEYITYLAKALDTKANFISLQAFYKKYNLNLYWESPSLEINEFVTKLQLQTALQITIDTHEVCKNEDCAYKRWFDTSKTNELMSDLFIEIKSHNHTTFHAKSSSQPREGLCPLCGNNLIMISSYKCGPYIFKHETGLNAIKDSFIIGNEQGYPTRYNLFGFINHSNQHFISYMKHKDSWFCFDMYHDTGTVCNTIYQRDDITRTSHDYIYNNEYPDPITICTGSSS